MIDTESGSPLHSETIMKTTGIRVQWTQIIFYNPNFQPCRLPELNVTYSLMNFSTCSVFFLAFAQTLVCKLHPAFFSLAAVGVWPDEPDYEGSLLALSGKKFPFFL